MAEWINVKDKLPEKGIDVLFIMKSSGKYKYMDGRMAVGRFDEAWNGKALFSTPGMGIEGTHWMPLPSRPMN